MYRVYKDESGLAIATAEMPHMSSISLGIWVGVGGRYEPAHLCGASHFIEHMLFKGTKRRSAKEISQDIEGIGGYLNAFTSEENTCFFSKAGHSHFEDLWDVLADMFLNSTFDPHELEKERSVIREELAMYQDQPHHFVQELLNEMLWPDQPLGRPLTGTADSLTGLNRANLLAYMRENYVTHGTLIAIAGRVDAKNVAKRIKRQLGRFPRSERRPFLPAHAEQDAPRVRLLTKPIEQTQFALGFSGLVAE
jgi:predicted Zn-dependent peptidase